MNIALWIIQVILALLFIMVGSMKLFMPITGLQKNLPWVGDVTSITVRYIGTCELLGGLGLILPAFIHSISDLTIVAAFGLALVMIYAGIFHFTRKEFSNIPVNVVLLVLAVFLAIGRLLLSPL